MRRNTAFLLTQCPASCAEAQPALTSSEVPASGPGLAAVRSARITGPIPASVPVEERWLEFTGRANAPRVSKPGNPIPATRTSPTREEVREIFPLQGKSPKATENRPDRRRRRRPPSHRSLRTNHRSRDRGRPPARVCNPQLRLRSTLLNHQRPCSVDHDHYCGLAIVTSSGR